MPTDPVSVASFALSLIKTAGEQLNKLRERAQATKDLEIKEHVGNLYDTMNSIKEAFSRLTDENKRLHGQLEQQSQKPTLKECGDTVYCFHNNEGPFCPRCYVNKEKLIPLPSPEDWNGGIRRECTLCGEYFYEKRMNSNPIQIGGRRGGPDSWME